MTTATWTAGDRFTVTETTAGAELLEIVTGWRECGRRYVVAASPEAAARIRAGALDWKVAVITGLGGRVRQMPRARFFELLEAGRIVRA